MKFTIVGEHRHYFHQHQSIEFQGLLSDDQLHQLQLGIESAIKKRLKSDDQRAIPSDNLFLLGRDLWRDDARVKKVTLSSQFAEIASELLERGKIRIGYDQFFPTPQRMIFESPYDNFISKTTTLEEISCLQGVLCGLLICVKGEENADEEKQEDGVFPRKAGNGVYFSAQKSIDFSELRHRAGQQFFLITYTEKTSVYVMREGDPLTHELKNIGYVFGDRLKDSSHPVLLR